jgi:hypothetical protein
MLRHTWRRSAVAPLRLLEALPSMCRSPAMAAAWQGVETSLGAQLSGKFGAAQGKRNDIGGLTFNGKWKILLKIQFMDELGPILRKIHMSYHHVPRSPSKLLIRRCLAYKAILRQTICL